METSPDIMVNLETGYINWEAIIDLSRDNKTEISYENGKYGTERKLCCKKCGEKFFNKNYFGNFALCDKHRNNTFKK